MQKLPKEITKTGFFHKQIDRKGKFALYEKVLIDVACSAKGELDKNLTIGYEVIIIRKQKAHERFGTQFPAKELYPSSETWGTYGWTFIQYLDACNKFKELCK